MPFRIYFGILVGSCDDVSSLVGAGEEAIRACEHEQNFLNSPQFVEPLNPPEIFPAFKDLMVHVIPLVVAD